MLRNGRKLLQVSRGGSDQVGVIHGLRVISMMWIVAGHSFISKEDKVDNVEASLRVSGKMRGPQRSFSNYFVCYMIIFSII